MAKTFKAKNGRRGSTKKAKRGGWLGLSSTYWKIGEFDQTEINTLAQFMSRRVRVEESTVKGLQKAYIDLRNESVYLDLYNDDYFQINEKVADIKDKVAQMYAEKRGLKEPKPARRPPRSLNFRTKKNSRPISYASEATGREMRAMGVDPKLGI
jgi:hypothetical protein